MIKVIVWGHGESSARVLRDAENAGREAVAIARGLGARCGLDEDGLHVEDWIVEGVIDEDRIVELNHDPTVIGYVRV